MDRSDRESRAEELLYRAQRLPPGERNDFLDVECAGDPALRAEIEKLLPFAVDLGGQPDLPSPVRPRGFALPSDAAGTVSAGDEAASPDGGRIGPYRLLQRIGEGGMGEVFLAEQDEPVRRRVALKLVKAGMDSKQVLARFEAERQALALMDHGSIARVYDAGSTPRGRPYFAMEYVKGEPITAYCDRQRLDTRQRIELFCKVCAGVEHAHQKGVIHRDLKPSNVLVSLQDGAPTPKIIDFGVAKATAQRLTDKTLFTQLGTLVGTPEYMSPEQAELTGLDVDTRSDVYSLGVMLYELLVGALPFHSKDLRSASFDEIRRRIREDEPSRPSSKVRTLDGAASTEAARRRRTTVPALRKALRGDLDWITMRALEKDRARRYGSPAELAADLDRHLRDEPVLAGPPSQVYRMRKFVRRHRLGVTAAMLVMAALIGGLSVATRGMVLARRAEAEARQEADTAAQVTAFLGNLFTALYPTGEARGTSVTTRELLDKGAQQIRTELVDRPLVRAKLQGIIGNVYRNLGAFSEARELLEASLETNRTLLGEDHQQTVLVNEVLGMLDVQQGHLDAGLRRHEEVRVGWERIQGVDGPRAIEANRLVGDTLRQMGRSAQAEPVLRATLERSTRVMGDHDVTLKTKWSLGWLLLDAGRLVEAEALLRAAERGFREDLGADHPYTLDSMTGVGVVLTQSGRGSEAASLLERALAGERRVYGDRYPATLTSMTALAVADLSLDRFAEAEQLLRQALAVQLQTLGERCTDSAESLAGLGILCRRRGRYEESERFFERAMEAFGATVGEENPKTLAAKQRLGRVRLQLGRVDDAAKLFREMIETRRRVSGDDHVETVRAMVDLAATSRRQGRTDEAARWYEGAVEARERMGDAPRVSPVHLDYDLAGVAVLLGRRDDALHFLRRAVKAGWGDAWVLADPDLASLHGDPEFESIVAPIRESLTQSG